MALQLARPSNAGLFAGQAQLARRSARQVQVVKAAKTPASRTSKVKKAAPPSRTKKVKKAAKARKTAPSQKVIDLNEDTVGTIGSVGILGVAVLTAGSLFLNSASVEYSNEGQETVTEAVVPEPVKRQAALPEAQTGSKVKPESRDAPPLVAQAPTAEEEAPKAEPVQAPKYTPPPAIKADKSAVVKSTQGVDLDTSGAVPVSKPADAPPAAPAPKFVAPKAAPVAAAPKPAAASAAAASSSGGPSPVVIGGVAAVLVAAVAAAASGGGAEGAEGAAAAPTASLPVGATSEASADDRKKERQAWIASWKARSK